MNTETLQPAAGNLIHQRLAAVMADVDAIAKDRKNAAQGFNFRGVDDVYNALHPLFAKHGIYVRPEVIEKTQTERPTAKGGTQLHAVVKMRYHFTSSDGSSVQMDMMGEAADSGDKSLGKAAQYAFKLLLFQAFLIPTESDSDPDAQSTEWASQRGNGSRQDRGREQPARQDNRQRPAPQEPAGDDLRAIAPWLEKITKEGANGTEAKLDAVGAQIDAAIERGGLRINQAQDLALQRAFDAARANIRSRGPNRAAGEVAPDELPPTDRKGKVGLGNYDD